MIAGMGGGRRTAVACALALAATLATACPASARPARHPLERVVRELARSIGRDARADRHAPGTLVRRSGRGATITLTVYYAARPIAGAAYGGYEFAVVSRRGILEEVALRSFGQERAFPLGTRPPGEVWFDIHVARSHVRGGRVWVAGLGGGDAPRCAAPPQSGQPTSCQGGAWPREWSTETGAETILAEARHLLASARHHEPV